MNKKFAGLGLVMLAMGCGVLTPKQEGELTQIGLAILCATELEQLNDPALNALCEKAMGSLTTEQRMAVVAHKTTNAAAKARAVVAPPPPAPACVGGKDGGT